MHVKDRRPRVKPLKKLRRQGFNNLTKHLSFNLFDVCYAKTPEQKKAYLDYIDEDYNSQRWTEILTHCTKIIGANILNISSQDYEPQGASVTILICEEPMSEQQMVGQQTSEYVVGHLDKSHICVHTYPEAHPDKGICTFRADVEVSTCGKISPLHALNYLIGEFEPDVLNLDYRVRGFTRDISGRKVWIDHRIHTIQDFVDDRLLRKYRAIDVNVYQENLFHTKLMWKKVDLARYLHGGKDAERSLPPEARRKIRRQLKQEIEEIFYARNVRA